MKKLFIYLLPFILLGCTDDSDMPILEITGIYIESDENQVNYAKKPDRMPALVKGDIVDIRLKLDGNGEELRSFVLVNENEKIAIEMSFISEEISSELSDIKEGKLVFVDDVYETSISVRAEITEDMEGDQVLSFYLSSKAADSESADVKLILPTEIPATEE